MYKFRVKNRRTGFTTYPTVNVKNRFIAERILNAFFSIERFDIELVKED